MNKTRWFLIVPMFICLIALGKSTFLVIKWHGHQNPPIVDQASTKWHESKMTSDDPLVLRQHAGKLWTQLEETDDRARTFYQTGRSAIGFILVTSTLILGFCTAAFWSAKNAAGLEKES